MAYVDLTTRFVYELQTVFGDWSKLANNDKYFKEHGWQDGTMAVFLQAAAPTGWTKQTTVNARALRVVSGSGGGTGGSQDPSTEITLAHTHTISSDGTHTHTADDHIHYFDEEASAANATDFPPTTDNIGFNSNGYLRLINSSGGLLQDLATNRFLTPSSAVVTGSSGSHDHGGVTNSQLTNITLAYVDVLFCSKDTSSGYTDLSATFVHNVRHVMDFNQELATNDAFNFARRTPAGTVSLFGSAASPTGWTKLTTQDAKILRVVSGTPSSGGSADIASSITLAHDHGSITASGAHTHSVPNHQHQLKRDGVQSASNDLNLLWCTGSGGRLRNAGVSGGAGVNIRGNSDTDGGGTSTDPGTHQHATGSSLSNITLAYFNVIQASKDSSGAPTSYTDMTALFATYFFDQALLAYQEMQIMADNDAYLYFHTMPAAAVMFFFQSSAPLNWTKATTQNDSLLRIVSGATGGTGGGTGPASSGLTLAHTHSLDTKGHTHTFAHDHAVELNAVSVLTSGGSIGNIMGDHDGQIQSRSASSPSIAALLAGLDSTTMTMDTKQHNHGGATGSGLSNVTLAYADVIMCSKN